MPEEGSAVQEEHLGKELQNKLRLFNFTCCHDCLVDLFNTCQLNVYGISLTYVICITCIYHSFFQKLMIIFFTHQIIKSLRIVVAISRTTVAIATPHISLCRSERSDNTHERCDREFEHEDSVPGHIFE